MDSRSPTTADLCDAAEADGSHVQVCHAPLRHYGGRRRVAAAMSCVRVFEDAALVRHCLAQPGEGRVLVVDGGGWLRKALLGDRMAALALAHGWAGLVIHGAVRDVAALATMPLLLLALGHVPQRGGRSGGGEAGGRVSFGDIVFTPGHWLCADSDGLVILPAAPFPAKRDAVSPPLQGCGSP